MLSVKFTLDPKKNMYENNKTRQMCVFDEYVSTNNNNFKLGYMPYNVTVFVVATCLLAAFEHAKFTATVISAVGLHSANMFLVRQLTEIPRCIFLRFFRFRWT